MQCPEECDQCSGLRRAQVLSICRHISPTLDHLPNELIRIKAQRDLVERGSPFSTLIVERVAVVALLCLEHKRTPAF